MKVTKEEVQEIRTHLENMLMRRVPDIANTPRPTCQEDLMVIFTKGWNEATELLLEQLEQ